MFSLEARTHKRNMKTRITLYCGGMGAGCIEDKQKAVVDSKAKPRTLKSLLADKRRPFGVASEALFRLET